MEREMASSYPSPCEQYQQYHLSLNTVDLLSVREWDERDKIYMHIKM